MYYIGFFQPWSRCDEITRQRGSAVALTAELLVELGCLPDIPDAAMFKPLADCRANFAIRLEGQRRFVCMRLNPRRNESGKLGWIFLWLIGVPLPILLVLYLLRGCT